MCIRDREIDYTAQKFYHKKLNSIYIGGGTPTTLSPCLLYTSRELTLSDLPALYELYAKPGMTAFVEPLYDYETELEYQKASIENRYGFYEYGMWLVLSRETGKLIGRAGLEHDELGYMIAPELWNLSLIHI